MEDILTQLAEPQLALELKRHLDTRHAGVGPYAGLNLRRHNTHSYSHQDNSDDVFQVLSSPLDRIPASRL
jgi:hypothetical protein